MKRLKVTEIAGLPAVEYEKGRFQLFADREAAEKFANRGTLRRVFAYCVKGQEIPRFAIWALLWIAIVHALKL